MIKINMTKNKLTQFMTVPSKIAGALDWKKTSGSILSLKFERDCVSMNLAPHPSLKLKIQSLDPILIKYMVRNNRKVLVASVRDKLQDIVLSNKVCGFVVDWPLQKEGRKGASCGRVLHFLDNLLEAQVLTQNRRFCLWNGDHITMETEDNWGRCSAYGRKCEVSGHIDSGYQYANTSTNVVADMWSDFAETHWPEMYKREKSVSTVPSPRTCDYFNSEWLEHVEQEGAYLQTSTL